MPIIAEQKTEVLKVFEILFRNNDWKLGDYHLRFTIAF